MAKAQQAGPVLLHPIRNACAVHADPARQLAKLRPLLAPPATAVPRGAPASLPAASIGSEPSDRMDPIGLPAALLAVAAPEARGRRLSAACFLEPFGKGTQLL